MKHLGTAVAVLCLAAMAGCTCEQKPAGEEKPGRKNYHKYLENPYVAEHKRPKAAPGVPPLGLRGPVGRASRSRSVMTPPLMSLEDSMCLTGDFLPQEITPMQVRMEN